MGKKMYIWNDLNIFRINFNDNLLKNNLIINFKEIEYISNEEIKEWKKNLRISDSNCLTLGTRPSYLFSKFKQFKISRIRNNEGQTIGFKNTDSIFLKDRLNQEKISFIEDVIVEGKTIEYILDEIISNRYNGQICFYVFCANKITIKKLIKKYDNLNLKFHVYKYMSGKPIVESTLLCLYDLYYEKIGNFKYIDCVNLYEQFFGDNAENFIQQVKFYGKELKMKKIIVTDLDKTLLNDDQLISEKNIKAIYDLLDNNVKVIFASGRSYENIKIEILEKYHLNLPVASLNGAQIYIEDGILVQKYPINNPIIEKIINLCDKHDVFYLIFTENNTYANYMPNLIKSLYLLAKTKSDNIETILKGMQIYYNLFYKYELLNDDIKFKIKNGDTEIYKMEIITHDKNFLNEICGIIPQNLNITSSSNVNLEITQDNITKANAINFFSKYYNINKENIYAIGDNLNDLEMIEEVGCGIAVANAIEEVKDKANLIVGSYDNDGFYEMAKKILKNEI